MWDTKKQNLKAVLWNTFVHYNLLFQKKWKHYKNLMDVFHKVLSSVKDDGFEKRIRELKPQKCNILRFSTS